MNFEIFFVYANYMNQMT